MDRKGNLVFWRCKHCWRHTYIRPHEFKFFIHILLRIIFRCVYHVYYSVQGHTRLPEVNSDRYLRETTKGKPELSQTCWMFGIVDTVTRSRTGGRLTSLPLKKYRLLIWQMKGSELGRDYILRFILQNEMSLFFYHCATVPSGSGPHHNRGFTIAHI